MVCRERWRHVTRLEKVDKHFGSLRASHRCPNTILYSPTTIVITAPTSPSLSARKRSAGMMSGEWLVEEVVWVEKQGEHVVNRVPTHQRPGHWACLSSEKVLLQ